MQNIRDIVVSVKEPYENVLWLRPENGDFILYTFLNGEWIPVGDRTDDVHSYLGVATPDTIPDNSKEGVFYLAGEGTYPNFGGLVVEKNTFSTFLYLDGLWILNTVSLSIEVDKELDLASENSLENKKITEELYRTPWADKANKEVIPELVNLIQLKNRQTNENEYPITTFDAVRKGDKTLNDELNVINKGITDVSEKTNNIQTEISNINNNITNLENKETTNIVSNSSINSVEASADNTNLHLNSITNNVVTNGILIKGTGGTTVVSTNGKDIIINSPTGGSLGTDSHTNTTIDDANLLYLIGVESTELNKESGSTNSNSKCYIDNNLLYSNEKQVSTVDHTHPNLGGPNGGIIFWPTNIVPTLPDGYILPSICFNEATDDKTGNELASKWNYEVKWYLSEKDYPFNYKPGYFYLKVHIINTYGSTPDDPAYNWYFLIEIKKFLLNKEYNKLNIAYDDLFKYNLNPKEKVFTTSWNLDAEMSPSAATVNLEDIYYNTFIKLTHVTFHGYCKGHNNLVYISGDDKLTPSGSALPTTCLRTIGIFGWINNNLIIKYK